MASVAHVVARRVAAGARHAFQTQRVALKAAHPCQGVLGVSTGMSSLRWAAPRACTASATQAPTKRFFGVMNDPDAESPYYPESQVMVSAPAPTFTAPVFVNGEMGQFNLEDYKGKWVVMFFYPKDFSGLCPTEMIAFSDRAAEFEALNTQVVSVSTDTAECHRAWTNVGRDTGGIGPMQIPMVADMTKEISSAYGVLLEDKGIALRGLFIIDPDGVLQHITVNNLPVARSVDDTMRSLQAFQFNREHGALCPADWRPDSTPSPAASAGAGASASSSSAAAPASSSVEACTPEEFHEAISKGTSVVMFHAGWCTKCKTIEPLFDELSGKNEGTTFVKFDTALGTMHALADSLDLTALPSFRVFKDGQAVGRDIIGHKHQPLIDAVARL